MKITKEQLKTIIKEELQNAAGGYEEREAKIVDHVESMDSTGYALAMME
jgi:hypothetical protein